MPEYLSKEKRSEIFQQYGGNEKNTGSTEGQIALYTFRIKGLADHLKANHKDHSCRRSLLTMVGKRKRLLNYLKRKDIARFRTLKVELNIR